MKMMACLALLMGLDYLPPPTFEIQPPEIVKQYEHTAYLNPLGYYRWWDDVAVLGYDTPILRAHESVHKYQYLNGMPFNEEEANYYSIFYYLYCGEGYDIRMEMSGLSP